MKRILTSLVTVMGIATALAPSLTAQTQQTVADIPFSFNVGGLVMPAGKYVVGRTTLQADVFQLGDGRKHSALVQFGSKESRKSVEPSLTFACYDKECILAKLTPAGSETSYSLTRDTLQRRLHYRAGVASMISVKLAPR